MCSICNWFGNWVITHTGRYLLWLPASLTFQTLNCTLVGHTSGFLILPLYSPHLFLFSLLPSPFQPPLYPLCVIPLPWAQLSNFFCSVSENWALGLARVMMIPEEPLTCQMWNLFAMLVPYLILIPLINIWFKWIHLCVEGEGSPSMNPMIGNDTANAWYEVIIHTKDESPDNWIRPHRLSLYHRKW